MLYLAYVFPNPLKPQKDWENDFEVTCEWENKWSHKIVPQCIDPRGCELPPERTSTIYSSFRHDSDMQDNIPVGTLVWYKCDKGNKIHVLDRSKGHLI